MRPSSSSFARRSYRHLAVAAELAGARRRWIREQGWLDTARLVFIDETAITTAAIPQRGAGCELDDAIGPAVPQADPVALPDDVAILEDGGKLFVGLAYDRPAAAPSAL